MALDPSLMMRAYSIGYRRCPTACWHANEVHLLFVMTLHSQPVSQAKRLKSRYKAGHSMPSPHLEDVIVFCLKVVHAHHTVPARSCCQGVFCRPADLQHVRVVGTPVPTMMGASLSGSYRPVTISTNTIASNPRRGHVKHEDEEIIELQTTEVTDPPNTRNQCISALKSTSTPAALEQPGLSPKRSASPHRTLRIYNTS
eukprot:scaffold19115_cov19-Tisochrysis_lutea.AAC.1